MRVLLGDPPALTPDDSKATEVLAGAWAQGRGCSRLRHELEAAGLVDVDVCALAAPLRLASATECVRFERESFGALHQMLAGLSADTQAAVWREITDALTEFEGPDGFVAPVSCSWLPRPRPLPDEATRATVIR